MAQTAEEEEDVRHVLKILMIIVLIILDVYNTVMMDGNIFEKYSDLHFHYR